MASRSTYASQEKEVIIPLILEKQYTEILSRISGDRTENIELLNHFHGVCAARQITDISSLFTSIAAIAKAGVIRSSADLGELTKFGEMALGAHYEYDDHTVLDSLFAAVDAGVTEHLNGFDGLIKIGKAALDAHIDPSEIFNCLSVETFIGPTKDLEAVGNALLKLGKEARDASIFARSIFAPICTAAKLGIIELPEDIEPVGNVLLKIGKAANKESGTGDMVLEFIFALLNAGAIECRDDLEDVGNGLLELERTELELCLEPNFSYLYLEGLRAIPAIAESGIIKSKKDFWTIENTLIAFIEATSESNKTRSDMLTSLCVIAEAGILESPEDLEAIGNRLLGLVAFEDTYRLNDSLYKYCDFFEAAKNGPFKPAEYFRELLDVGEKASKSGISPCVLLGSIAVVAELGIIGSPKYLKAVGDELLDLMNPTSEADCNSYDIPESLSLVGKRGIIKSPEYFGELMKIGKTALGAGINLPDIFTSIYAVAESGITLSLDALKAIENELLNLEETTPEPDGALYRDIFENYNISHILSAETESDAIEVSEDLGDIEDTLLNIGEKASRAGTSQDSMFRSIAAVIRTGIISSGEHFDTFTKTLLSYEDHSINCSRFLKMLRRNLPRDD